MDESAAVKIENVSKTFKLPHEKTTSIKSAVVNFYRRDKSFELQKALEDITFDVRKGEFFGIIGSNGSGKSTLLKLLAGIYVPSRGNINVIGKLTPFIELGVGFNAELTGRENVYLNGSLLGFSRKEMQKMYKDIVDFAELERFMDQKLKNYSSGMQVRLAFSIAIRAQSDILLIDEVLAVGDAGFQKKCFEYFYDLKKNKKTVIFVSHDMDSIQRFCNQCAWLKNGVLMAIGDSQEVVEKYRENIFDEESKKLQKQVNSSVVTDLSMKIKGDTIFSPNDKVKLNFSYKLLEKRDVELGVSLLKDAITFGNTSSKGIKLPSAPNTYEGELEIDLSYLMGGQYEVYFGLFDVKSRKELAFKNNAVTFYISDKGNSLNGIVRLNYHWNKLPGNKTHDRKG